MSAELAELLPELKVQCGIPSLVKSTQEVCS